MRRLLLLAPFLVLFGCKEDTPADGAVKLTVAYTGFKPGCVRVVARDTGGAGESSTEVAGKGDVTGGAVTVAIFRGNGWGTELAVEAQAFERECRPASAGLPVARSSQNVTLEPGKPTPLELSLKARDTDGDGYVATADNGSDCDDASNQVFPGAQEVCNQADDNCNQQKDEGLSLSWRPDIDGDGKGDRNAIQVDNCQQPMGYVDNDLDCDDRDATRYFGAPELCDTKDNNCDNRDDVAELELGISCAPDMDQGCGGQRSCAGDGGVFCKATSLNRYYPDEDSDTYGGADAGFVSRCDTAAPPGYSATSTDCDDGNPFTHPTAGELCDLADNNCDGVNNDPILCLGNPQWIPVGSLSAAGQPWHSISLWGDGGVWISGKDQRRAVKQPGSPSFTLLTSSCNKTWYSVWAEPMTGRAYLGAQDGNTTYNDPTQSGCSSFRDSSLGAVQGLVGVPGPAGLEIYGVGTSTANPPVRSFVADRNGSTGRLLDTAGVSDLYDVHGRSREVLFAVGGDSNGGRVYRLDAGVGEWQSENVETTLPGAGRLDGVWVAHDRLAYAVGAGGTVLRWDGTAWSALPFPNNTETLTSVLAFGRNSVYATSASGKIYRYNGIQWETTNVGIPLNDIAGTSPGDLWVVGNNGAVLHWPK